MALKKAALLQALRFFRLKGSSERVARGFAVGILPNFLPTFGFGVLISGFLARLLGGNLAAGLVGGASLALVWPALFYLNMRVGGLLLVTPVEVDEVADVTETTINAVMWGKTFLLGATVNGLATGVVAYIAMLALYRKVQPHAVVWLRKQVQNRNRSRGPRRLRLPHRVPGT